VAEPTTTVAVNWLTVALSSAVISAVINILWNAFSKIIDKRREDAKEKKIVGHVYLDVVFSLESFAKQCNARLYDIDIGLNLRYEYHDDSHLNKLVPLTLQFQPEPRWSELPVDFVAQVKALPGRLESTHDWIVEQHDHWADIDDAYEFERERVAFYGAVACEIAEQIREKILAGKGDTEHFRNHFQSLIEKRRARFDEGSKEAFIPELRALFGESNRTS